MASEAPAPPTLSDELAEKQSWTPPKIMKMDIEETAISVGQTFDADGFS